MAAVLNAGAARSILLWLLLAGCARPADSQPEARENPTAGRTPGVTAFVDVHVVPMTADTVLRHHTVVVREGRIVAVGPHGETPVPEGARVIAGEGRYLLPGLIDFHVHLRAESELRSYLRHGVTTVVNMRGSPEVLALRERIRRGEVPGPRIFTAGPLLDGEPPIWSGSGTRVVRSPGEAPDVVRDHLRAGYDLVKVYNNLDPEVLAAVVREAHGAGLAVAGHLPRRPVREEGLRRALAADLDLIAHGEEVFFTHLGGAPDSLMRTGRYVPPDEDELRGVAGLIRDSGAAVTPNLSFIAMTARMLDDVQAVFSDAEFERLDPEIRELWREQNPTRREDLDAFRRREEAKYRVVRTLTRLLQRAGVPLLLGTDASAPGLYPGKSAHVELRELVRAGLTPYQALAAGTRNAGRFFVDHVRGAEPVGVILPGHAADLLLLDRNPLEDVGAVEDPAGVMVRGRWLPGEQGGGSPTESR